MPRPHLSKLRPGFDSTSENTDYPSSEPLPPFCTQSLGERARCQHTPSTTKQTIRMSPTQSTRYQRYTQTSDALLEPPLRHEESEHALNTSGALNVASTSRATSEQSAVVAAHQSDSPVAASKSDPSHTLSKRRRLSAPRAQKPSRTSQEVHANVDTCTAATAPSAPQDFERSAPTTRTQKPDRIRRPPNAFILFRTHSFQERKNETGMMKQSMLSKIIGEEWRQLSENEKAVWMQKAEKAKEEHRLRYPDYVFRPARNNGTRETSKKRVCGETESGSEPHCGQLPKRATKRARIHNPTPQSISRVASEPAMAVAGMLTSSSRMQRHASAPCIGEAMTEHLALPTIPSTHLATTLQRPPRGTSVSRHRRSAAHPVAFNTPMTLGHTTPVDLLYSSLPPLELDPALFDPAFLYSAVQGFGTQDASFAPQASYLVPSLDSSHQLLQPAVHGGAPAEQFYGSSASAPLGAQFIGPAHASRSLDVDVPTFDPRFLTQSLFDLTTLTSSTSSWNSPSVSSLQTLDCNFPDILALPPSPYALVNPAETGSLNSDHYIAGSFAREQDTFAEQLREFEWLNSRTVFNG